MKNLQIDKDKLLNAISDVQSMFIQDKPIKEVFNQMLKVLLDITKSEYGFIGEIFNDGQQDFLKTLLAHIATMYFPENNISVKEIKQYIYEKRGFLSSL